MFDDGFRAGWWPLAAVGFVASIAAVVVLSDVEVQPDMLEERAPEPLTGHQPG